MSQGRWWDPGWRLPGAGLCRRRIRGDHNGPGNEGAAWGAIPNGNFRADVHRVAFITPLMIAELPGTAKLPFTETKTATRRSPYAHHEGLPFLK